MPIPTETTNTLTWTSICLWRARATLTATATETGRTRSGGGGTPQTPQTPQTTTTPYYRTTIREGRVCNQRTKSLTRVRLAIYDMKLMMWCNHIFKTSHVETYIIILLWRIPEAIIPIPMCFFVFFNAFILWNNEAVVPYTWPLTCGIPRPMWTQASRCGTPSLWLLFWL
jgi:hypothetical protein